jgi:pyridoxamine 5'-phosphate oxidase
VPLPSFWGGFRVSIEQMEFWQGGEHRLHDRFYTSAKRRLENRPTGAIIPKLLC